MSSHFTVSVEDLHNSYLFLIGPDQLIVSGIYVSSCKLLTIYASRSLKHILGTCHCPKFCSLSTHVDLIPRHWVVAALQLSVQDSTSDSADQSNMSKLLTDQSFVSSILASVRFPKPTITICFFFPFLSQWRK